MTAAHGGREGQHSACQSSYRHRPVTVYGKCTVSMQGVVIPQRAGDTSWVQSGLEVDLERNAGS